MLTVADLSHPVLNLYVGCGQVEVIDNNISAYTHKILNESVTDNITMLLIFSSTTRIAITTANDNKGN